MLLLTDYFRPDHDAAWDLAAAAGVRHAVIRLPEDGRFDYGDGTHWDALIKKFTDFGVTPVAIEPMPNELHDHIKLGDNRRDESIARVIAMLPQLRDHGIQTICFNWMAHIGWLRTRTDCPERGGARVTGFRIEEFSAGDAAIGERELWENYEYFLRAVLPHAERYGIRLALHPDDPPVPRLGGVARIMSDVDGIRRAVLGTVKSESLGVAMCQANFYLMGADLYTLIPELAERIYMVHFRNVRGIRTDFCETWQDNGELDMAALMRLYCRLGVCAPVRVDHVPSLPREEGAVPGYDAIGRLFAIGYLKGMLDYCKQNLPKGEGTYDQD